MCIPSFMYNIKYMTRTWNVLLRSLFCGFVGVLYVPELLCQDFLNTAFNSTNVVNSTLVTCCTELYNRCVCACFLKNVWPSMHIWLVSFLLAITFSILPFLLIRINTADVKPIFSDAICEYVYFMLCLLLAVWQCLSYGTWRPREDSV